MMTENQIPTDDSTTDAGSDGSSTQNSDAGTSEITDDQMHRRLMQINEANPEYDPEGDIVHADALESLLDKMRLKIIAILNMYEHSHTLSQTLPGSFETKRETLIEELGPIVSGVTGMTRSRIFNALGEGKDALKAASETWSKKQEEIRKAEEAKKKSKDEKGGKEEGNKSDEEEEEQKSFWQKMRSAIWEFVEDEGEENTEMSDTEALTRTAKYVKEGVVYIATGAVAAKRVANKHITLKGLDEAFGDVWNFIKGTGNFLVDIGTKTVELTKGVGEAFANTAKFTWSVATWPFRTAKKAAKKALDLEEKYNLLNVFNWYKWRK